MFSPMFYVRDLICVALKDSLFRENIHKCIWDYKTDKYTSF